MTERLNAAAEISDERVRGVFDGYPEAARARLLALRDLILETATGLEELGGVTETLKWGQPSYLPAKAGVGTTVRIDARKAPETGYAVYVHCQTTLVDQYRELYPGLCRYDSNRALLFDNADEVDRDALRHCIALAFTYHARRKQRR